MKAVCTILGWCTAAAVGGGAGISMPSGGWWSFGAGVGGLQCECSCMPFTPFASRSGLLLADRGADDELVVVATSMGSPGEGADICIVGVMIGTVLAPMPSSRPSGAWLLGRLSATAAIRPISPHVSCACVVARKACRQVTTGCGVARRAIYLCNMASKKTDRR